MKHQRIIDNWCGNWWLMKVSDADMLINQGLLVNDSWIFSKAHPEMRHNLSLLEVKSDDWILIYQEIEELHDKFYSIRHRYGSATLLRAQELLNSWAPRCFTLVLDVQHSCYSISTTTRMKLVTSSLLADGWCHISSLGHLNYSKPNPITNHSLTIS